MGIKKMMMPVTIGWATKCLLFIMFGLNSHLICKSSLEITFRRSFFQKLTILEYFSSHMQYAGEYKGYEYKDFHNCSVTF